MGLGRRALTTSGLGLVAVLAAGCGSSQGLLSSHSHDALTSDLFAVRQAVANGDCTHTADALTELDTTIDGLPEGTNATLARNLRQGAAVTRRWASKDCHHKAPKPPVTTSTQSTSTTTTTTTTSTTVSTTAATTSSTPAPPETTTATQTTPPPTTTTTPAPPTTTPGATTSSGGGGLTPGGGDNGDQNGSGNG
jgi:hypothetical protein